MMDLSEQENGFADEILPTAFLETIPFSLSCFWQITVSGLLVFIVALAYSNSLQVPFVFDDIQSIKNNELITRFDAFTLENVKRFWISKFDRGRPVALFTFALNHGFGGFSPIGYHIVNIVIHILSGIAVFLVTRFLLVESPVLLDSVEADFGHVTVNAIAGLTALIWALHPVQTASVTYIVQRMSSLAGMFYFWGIYFYLRKMRARSRLEHWGFFLLTVLFFFFGLGSKEIVATLPIAIWLIRWILFPDPSEDQGLGWAQFSGVILFFVIVGLFFLVDNKGVIETLKGKIFRSGGSAPTDWSTGERLMTEGRIVLRYLLIVFVPLPQMLNLDRYPEVSTGLLSPPATLISIILIVGAILWAFIYHKNYPVVSFCFFWFGLHLVITSTVLPLELMYDHRLYIPLFAPVFLVVYVFITSVRLPMLYRLGIGGVLPVLLAASTYARNLDWSSEISLYRDVVQKTPRNPRGHSNLGVAFFDKAERFIDQERYDQAFKYLQKAKKQFQRTSRLLKKQKYAERGKARVKRHQVHRSLAFVELERGNVKEAFSYLQNISPSKSGEMPGTIMPIIQALVENGNYKKAIRKCLQILSRAPDQVAVHLLLVEGYIDRDRFQVARKILNRSPEPADKEDRIRFKLLRGRLQMHSDEPEPALELFHSALRETSLSGFEDKKLIADIHEALAHYHDTVTGDPEKRTEHARKTVEILGEHLDNPKLKRWAKPPEDPKD